MSPIVETFSLGCDLIQMCVISSPLPSGTPIRRKHAFGKDKFIETPPCLSSLLNKTGNGRAEQGHMACRIGTQATPRRGVVSSDVSRHFARPFLGGNCSSSPSLASCHVDVFVSKSSKPTRLQLTRRALTKQQRQIHAIRCQASGGSQAAPNPGLVSTIRQFVLDQFLPIGLLLAMLIGCAASALCMLLASALSEVYAC